MLRMLWSLKKKCLSLRDHTMNTVVLEIDLIMMLEIDVWYLIMMRVQLGQARVMITYHSNWCFSHLKLHIKNGIFTKY